MVQCSKCERLQPHLLGHELQRVEFDAQQQQVFAASAPAGPAAAVPAATAAPAASARLQSAVVVEEPAALSAAQSESVAEQLALRRPY